MFFAIRSHVRVEFRITLQQLAKYYSLREVYAEFRYMINITKKDDITRRFRYK